MDLMTRDILKSLADQPERGPCVSIYIPTHRMGEEGQQDPIRFKNALADAENKLRDYGLRRDDITEIIEPARALQNEGLEFWLHQGDGLAVFLAPGVFQYYRLPISFDELVVVSERFHLKPLLPLLTGDGQFYILALSQNEVRLLQATRHTVAEVELENIPESLAEALKYDDPEKQVVPHTTGQATGGATGRAPAARGPAVFHGHGAREDNLKEDILRYFKMIDNGLMEHLADKRAPMVIAAVDYLHPIYEEANHYRYLLPEGVLGNPDGWRNEELLEKAWKVVGPHFEGAYDEAVEKYKQQTGTGQTSRNLKEIVPAAAHGRVDTLFVQVGLQRWGHANPDENQVEVHDEMQSGDEDLLDYAAVQTLLNGGVVYAVEPAKIPDGAPVAAHFRY